METDPADSASAQVDAQRTEFLEAMLDDEERGRLAPLETYVARFPTIATFVRDEYAALTEQLPAAAAADEPARPASCGRYRLTRQLGEGGMGTVHEAWDPELSRRVVVKTLRPDIGPTGKAAERLRREARVLGRLDHQALAKIIDVVEEGGRVHLVMPYHEGRTLAECIAAARARTEANGGASPIWPQLGPPTANATVGVRAIVAFFVRTAQALHSAHRAGVVHRDLKPQNLLVAPDGSPIVIDFGLALPQADDRLTQAGELLGTPLYMAPEQIEGGVADARTDVYALAVTLYETLTLVHPFAGPAGRAAVFQRVLHKEPVPPRRHQPRLPRDLEAVVLRALERQPKNRYADMVAFATDLQRVLDYESTDARPVSGVGRAWRGVRRRPAVSGLAVVAVIATAIAARNWVVASEQRAGHARNAERAGQGIADPAKAEWALLEIQKESRRYRSASSQHAEPGPVFPRGKVSLADAFVWVGLPTTVERVAGIRFVYDYRVEVLDSAGRLIRQWTERQPEQRVCVVRADDLVLAPGTYRWRVALTGADQEVSPGADPTMVQALGRVGAEEVRRANPGLDFEAAFTVAPLPAGFPGESAGAEARATWLLEREYAAEALQVLDADASAQEPQTTPARRAELVARAAQLLGDAAREASAREALARPPREGGR